LPFYYRKLAGNISDVKTIKKLLADMNTMGYKKIKVVLDRGFLQRRQYQRVVSAPPEVPDRWETIPATG
jgi:transposase